MLKLGVHVSISGKIYKSVDRALELGCNTMQIFSRNPRQLRKSEISKEDTEEFKKKVKASKLSPIIIHIPYTLNLATSKREFYKITIREFIADLKEADQLAADYLITHMGSFKGGTERGGLLRIANALNKILKETQGTKTKILLENTSGSGHWLGYTFSHHKFIFDKLHYKDRVGICLDTAHAWAAGYKIDSIRGLEVLLNDIDENVGLTNLKVIHINDTKEELGSRQDRHYAIGEGNISKKGFRLILNHDKLKRLPFILETPKKNEDDDINNLTVVRKLYKNGIYKEH